MAGYLPVDTPPGTTPMPLGSPVPAGASKGGPPRAKGKKFSGKGRVKKPGRAFGKGRSLAKGRR